MGECVSGAAAGETGAAGSRFASSLQALPSRPRWLVSECVSEWVNVLVELLQVAQGLQGAASPLRCKLCLVDLAGWWVSE